MLFFLPYTGSLIVPLNEAIPTLFAFVLITAVIIDIFSPIFRAINPRGRTHIDR